jgi:hypothetical protein
LTFPFKAPALLDSQLDDALLVRAVRDAYRLDNPALRSEALAWLWVCCPDVADELALPTPEAATLTQLVAAYVTRQAA